MPERLPHSPDRTEETERDRHAMRARIPRPDHGSRQSPIRYILLFAFVVCATSGLAGPPPLFVASMDPLSIPRPLRGALGIWSLVGLLLVHAGVSAGVIGWSQVLRAVAPRRLTSLRGLVERRPGACLLLGLFNWVVVAIVLGALGRHAPPLSLVVIVAAVTGAASGIAGMIEGLGMRLSPPAAEDPSVRPGPAHWRGGVALGLALVVPFLGQALLLVILCIGLGAATLSPFMGPAPKEYEISRPPSAG